jgi:hypothetical protein
MEKAGEDRTPAMGVSHVAVGKTEDNKKPVKVIFYKDYQN